ncbi:MAG: hypothetical protein LBK67_13615 [Coriobacteriales bacterium]|jgi:hypothetical protein|nr:hypothetical protein [Coriobacteriales bacterium]
MRSNEDLQVGSEQKDAQKTGILYELMTRVRRGLYIALTGALTVALAVTIVACQGDKTNAISDGEDVSDNTQPPVDPKNGEGDGTPEDTGENNANNEILLGDIIMPKNTAEAEAFIQSMGYDMSKLEFKDLQFIGDVPPDFFCQVTGNADALGLPPENGSLSLTIITSDFEGTEGVLGGSEVRFTYYDYATADFWEVGPVDGDNGETTIKLSYNLRVNAIEESDSYGKWMEELGTSIQSDRLPTRSWVLEIMREYAQVANLSELFAMNEQRRVK